MRTIYINIYQYLLGEDTNIIDTSENFDTLTEAEAGITRNDHKKYRFIKTISVELPDNG